MQKKIIANTILKI